jgi:serine/threonine protein kinase/WD40 repeat protein
VEVNRREAMEAGRASCSEGDGVRDEVEVLAAEFLARRRRGERPTIQEYADRRPDLAAAIEDVFPTLLFVEELGAETSSESKAAGAGLLASEGGGAAAAAAGSAAAGLRQIGEYRILREIGRGGMGIVYEAEQESLGRHVALKILPFHLLLGPKHLERFLQEARAAARLSHPNIVPVFAIGEHLGLNYFVMQYIPGQGLDHVIAEVRRLRENGAAPSDSSIASDLGSRGGRERYHQNVARIARDAALALDYAHREGVLHRDVKPSNLLLDPTGHVWLADFGLAKSADSDHLTRSGDFLGTYRYMAPERFKGWSDPRSDVYALGLTLYELLALRPAFAEPNRERLLRKLASEDPPPLRKLDRAIPLDLETIVLKASAREPAQRYASAQAMADDLDRYLNGQPIAARRSTAVGRLARWCARNPSLASLAAVVALLVAAVTVVSSTAAITLQREQDAGREKLRSAYIAQAQALRFSGRPGQRFDALETIAEAARIRPGPDARDEAAACVGLADVRVLESWKMGEAKGAYFDAELRHVALPMADGQVSIVVLAEGREIWRAPGPGFQPDYFYGSFHPDGRYLSVRYHRWASGGIDRWVVWDLEKQTAAATVEDGEGTDAIDVDPRDRSLLVPALGGVVRTIEVPSGRTISEQRFPFRIGAMALHPGGELMALARLTSGKDAYLVERRLGRILRTFSHEGRPSDLAWHPGGRLLAASCMNDFRVYLWDAESGALRWSADGHEAEAIRVKFHPRGDILCSAGWDNRLRFWDPTSGRSLFALSGRAASFSAGGEAIAVMGSVEYEKRELSPRRDAFTLFGHEQPGTKQPHGVALARGSRIAATWGDDGVRLWDLERREESAHLATGWTRVAEFDASGSSLVSAGLSGCFRWPIRFRQAAGRRRLVLGPAQVLSTVRVHHAALGDAGRRVAISGTDGSVYDLPLDRPEEIRKLAHARPSEFIAFSPDGRWMAGTSKRLDQSFLWETSDETPPIRLDAGYGFLAFDPQVRYLVAGMPREYVILKAGDWKPVRRIPRSSGLSFFAPAAFDRSGSMMALSLTDHRLGVFEVESGRGLVEFEAADPRRVDGIALDLESGMLAASSRTGRFHVWDLPGIERQLGAIDLSWDLRLPPETSSPRPRLEIECLAQGSALGLRKRLDDPRAPVLWRESDRVLFRPRLESYSEIDVLLQAPRFLIPEGAAWRFHRGLSEPSPALEWVDPEFDDSRWDRGESGIGSYTRDGETRTSLMDQFDSYTTLYLRHAFELAEIEAVEKLLFGIYFEDGFVAYLNGREIARRQAGKPGTRVLRDALATRIAAQLRQEHLSAVDASLLRPGKNVLAVHGLTYGLDSCIFMLPVLAASLASDEARDRDRAWSIAPGDDGAPHPALAAYRDGGTLQRAGRFEDAIAAFERAAAIDAASPEPLLRRLECHRALGEHERAETLAREAISGGELIDDGGVWVAWIDAMSRGLEKPLRELLAAWPEAPPAPNAGRGSDLRWVVEELAASGALRINCGGPAVAAGSGKRWGADRCFVSGALSTASSPSGGDPPAEGGDLAEIRRSHRRFPGDRQMRPAYSVPLVPGRYRVGLHFPETAAPAAAFTILIEGRMVREGFSVLRPEPAAAAVETFEIEVDDGFLDLDFLAETGEPMVAGIEIERIGGS